MKKNKYSRVGGWFTPTCPCPLLNNQSGCNDPNGLCYAFQEKWQYTCDPTQPAVEYFFCRIGNFFEGLGLTILQYGALPVVLIGTTVAAGYIKYAES